MRVLWLLLISIAVAPLAGSPIVLHSALTFKVIDNANNPLVDISLSKLRDILLGNTREWPNRRRITVVQREAQNPLVSDVLRQVLAMSIRDYTRYLLQLEFKGSEPLQMKTLVSDEGTCEFVRNAPGAMGFISGTVVSSLPCAHQVRILLITGAAHQPNIAGSR